MIGSFSIGRLILCAAAVCLWAVPSQVNGADPELELLLVLDGETAGDQFGVVVSGLGDVNGDGYDDFLISAPYNASAGANTGRTYIYLGGPVVDGTPDLIISGPVENAYLGPGAGAGDVNGDGYDDFLVGAWGYAGRTGRAWLYLGGPVLSGTPHLTFDGETTWSMFGNYLAALGDVNNDTHNDFLIMAPWWGGYHGRAYVYFGGPGLDNVADLVFNGPAGGEFGTGTAAGRDYNGDGHNDMLIGAYKSGSGRCWLFNGGPGLDGVADMMFSGTVSIGWYSSPLRPAGDVNGDGYDDFLSGERAPYNNAVPGSAYLYFGGPGIDATPDLVLTGEMPDDGYGAAAGVGDLNGDGFGDFVVGAYDNDETGDNAGKAYVYFGGSTPDATPEYTMTGEAAGDNYGIIAEALGDINGDGTPDFAVTAYMHDATGENSGRVYIYTLKSLVVMDIKPTSCPNPLNVKKFGDLPNNAKSKKGGILPVAILGSASLDVHDIDVSSLLLEGVAPIRHNYEDVAAPVENGDECECTTAGPDGFMDLTLKLEKSEIIATLGSVGTGDLVELTLTGDLLDGTPFDASDCVTILAEKLPVFSGESGDGVVLGPAVPNPFNPITRISYVLPSEGFVTLSVHDVTGKLVTRLISQTQGAGEHAVEWDAKGQPSGIYFCRIEVGAFVDTRKMILLK